MTVVECPHCHSRFNLDETAIDKDTIKLRCSVCSEVFSLSLKEETSSLEQEFDSLLSEDTSESITIEETDEDSTEKDQGQAQQAKTPEHESVIREIDAILGSGDEVKGQEPDKEPTEGQTRKSKKLWVVLTLVLLLFVSVGLWLFLGLPPMDSQDQETQEKTSLERGPFFEIKDKSVTYKRINNRKEGTILVVKGIVHKLSPKKVEYVLLQTRVYDKDQHLLSSIDSYAGIIPNTQGLKQLSRKEIHMLLTSTPKTIGILGSSTDIPFIVPFFSATAQKGTSFQVEVKGFHWQ